MLNEGNSLKCMVTGNRRHSDDLPQEDMEIPCKLIFTNIKKLLNKIYPSQVQASKTSPPLKKKQKTFLATAVTQKVVVINDIICSVHHRQVYVG